ncbi:MAG: FAD-dependent oxidoreductase [Pseudomonadota bacterium]
MTSSVQQYPNPKIAVIGSGLIGSAAAKYLAEAGVDTTLVGPTEPWDKPRHEGVFGSHYDEGRITRKIDPSPFWSEVTMAAINRYRDIEARSDISFFCDVGAMVAGPTENPDIQSILDQSKQSVLPAHILEDQSLQDHVPMFSFANGTTAFFEASGAGHISPRKLVAAQRKLAAKAGATLIEEEVLSLNHKDGCTIVTESGARHFDTVLLATGGFAQHLSPVDIPLKTYARTVAFFRVSETEGHRLRAQPSLIYRFPDGRDPYLLPPIRYPDGQLYLKIGGDPEDRQLTSQAEINAWFRTDGDPQVAKFLTQTILELMPDLQIEEISHGSCVTSFTPDDRPLDLTPTSHLRIVAGACGKGAKCSDELGRRAAMKVLAPFGCALKTG